MLNGNQVLAQGLKAAKNGPPIKPGKTAGGAFLAGFLFGPFGTGIYLESFEDFFVPMFILIVATFLTAGIAAPVAWMFSGVYGASRVNESKAAGE